jgi:hypothetical protein
MKKTLLFCLASLFGFNSFAQVYQTATLSGFNSDVVANGSGSASLSTSAPVDITGYTLVALNFINPSGQSPNSGLPNNGTITSAVATTPGLTFQLASYSGNNALRLTTTGAGTLTFTTPKSAEQIYVLGFTGNGPSTANITVTFTDGTSQLFSGQSFADWYGGSGFAIQGISRVSRTTNAIENLTTNPRLYQNLLTLTTANKTKNIQNILVTKTSSAGVLNVMAVSIKNTASDINDDVLEKAIEIFPNPNSGTFKISVPAATCNLELADLTGKIINRQQVISQETTLTLPTASKGIYILKIETAGKIAFRKILID